MCKFESSQKDESRDQLVDSSKPYKKTLARAFNWHMRLSTQCKLKNEWTINGSSWKQQTGSWCAVKWINLSRKVLRFQV